MLVTQRPFHSSTFTQSIMSRFPDWMKLRDPQSQGFKFMDILVGNELEFLNSVLDYYKDLIFIDRSSVTTLENLYRLDIPYILQASIVYPTDKEGKVLSTPIYITEDMTHFLSNKPTAIRYTNNTVLGGLTGDIVGLEWLDQYPSGLLAVKQDVSDILPSSLLYYDILNRTNTITLTPVSGTALGLGYIGLSENSLYDIVEPSGHWNMEKLYPSGVWITPSGDVWYVPDFISAGTDSYIDEHNAKFYYQKLLNNPYGSGIYDKADVTLSCNPISGTIRVYDILNLTSGVPTEIWDTGRVYYVYTSGTWSYKGYDNPIPWDITPLDIRQAIVAQNGTPVQIVPNPAGTVSWILLPSGGYVDDEVYPHTGSFAWIPGTGGYGNTLRFDHAFSKYQIEYEYKKFESITQISAEPRNSEVTAAERGGTLFFISNSVQYLPLYHEQSDTNPNDIRMNPKEIRPGTSLYFTAQINTIITDSWMDAQTTDKTVQFYKHNIGVTDQLGKL